jgi:hypothetical protein
MTHHKSAAAAALAAILRAPDPHVATVELLSALAARLGDAWFKHAAGSLRALAPPGKQARVASLRGTDREVAMLCDGVRLGSTDKPTLFFVPFDYRCHRGLRKTLTVARQEGIDSAPRLSSGENRGGFKDDWPDQEPRQAPLIQALSNQCGRLARDQLTNSADQRPLHLLRRHGVGSGLRNRGVATVVSNSLWEHAQVGRPFQHRSAVKGELWI